MTQTWAVLTVPFSCGRMIYKCAMCDTVFTHKPLLSSHFDQHLLNQRVSVFKCPDCPLLFAQKRTMLEHLKVTPWPCAASWCLSTALCRGRPGGHCRVSCSAGGKSWPRSAANTLVFAFQNTHQPQKPKDDLAKKAAVLLTPKQEPVETPVSKISEESSSSTEEDEPPSSPELRKTKRSRFQRKTVNKSKGSGWTCGVCHSWFPERDEYVSHMKKDHGKVRRRPGAPALPEGRAPRLRAGPGAFPALVWAVLLPPYRPGQEPACSLRFQGAVTCHGEQQRADI